MYLLEIFCRISAYNARTPVLGGPMNTFFAQLSSFPLSFLLISAPLANLALKNTLA
jgi:hypothetical protein